jgi:hypothetical protein
MNRFLILLLATLLGGLIVTVQLVRKRRAVLFDCVDVASWLYLVLFVLIPVYLQLADLSAAQDTEWRWIFRTPFANNAFVFASLIALIGYPLILFGVRGADALLATIARFKHAPRGIVNDQSARGDLLIAGLLLLGVGVLALGIYIWSIGGVRPFFVEALLFRGTDPPVVSRLAFLKNVSYALLGASYCFHAINAGASSRVRPVMISLLFGLAFGLSLIHLYHAAGRLPLVAFVATFPLTAMVQKAKWAWRTIMLLGVAGLGIILFGKELFFPRQAAELLASRWETVGNDASRVIGDVAIEFSFPYVTLANTTLIVPQESPYRMFVDFPLAAQYLVPQRVFGVTHAPMASMVNTELLNGGGSGTIPVDILSFGYFSAGVVGVVFVTLFLGFLFGLSEVLFQGSTGTVFRVSLTLFLGFRVMYGDPSLAAQSGFYLIMTTGLLLALGFVRRVLTREPDYVVITAHVPLVSD